MSYGSFEASLINWSSDTEEGQSFWKENLGIHKCSLEELGIEGDSSSFFAIPDSRKNETLIYANLFYCFDNPEKVVLNGDLSSSKGSNLNLMFNICLEDPALE